MKKTITTRNIENIEERNEATIKKAKFSEEQKYKILLIITRIIFLPILILYFGVIEFVRKINIIMKKDYGKNKEKRKILTIKTTKSIKIL